MPSRKHSEHEAPSRRERVLGVLLCLIGAGLAISMAAAAWHNVPTFLHPGEVINGERFTGTSLQGKLAVALIASVAMTGLVFGGVGARQAWTGRRDKRLRWLAALALGVTALIAWQMRSAL